jgi:hypothetical protein
MHCNITEKWVRFVVLKVMGRKIKIFRDAIPFSVVDR